jgi:bla regulator protein blaR1
MNSADLTSWAPLANHLWQSSVCVGAIWLITLALKNNRAAVRYWLWFAASVKFLIPFSTLVSLGGRLSWRTAAPGGQASRWSFVIDNAVQPFIAPAAVHTQASSPHPTFSLAPALIAIWFLGVAAGIVLWLRYWRRMRTICRNATPLPLHLPIPTLSSASQIEPGVFGIVRPVLLLPEGIESRLTPAQFDAILNHEVSHVRRLDNLTASIHMVVEMLFWFFPVVWWLRSRLVEEREHACDEEVLQAGAEPEPYAQAILNVCKFYTELPLACASGISGSGLKSRIFRIMKQDAAHKLSFGRKALLTSAIVVAVAGPLTFGAVNAPLHAKSQSEGAGNEPLPSFEVASIKLNRSDVNYRSIGSDLGRFTTIGAPATLLIRFAYNLQSDSEVSGGPGWINSDKYDINAKIEDELAEKLQKLPPEQRNDSVRLMVQSLLAERFKLKVSHATKDLPVYALVVAKNDSRLSRAKDPGPSGFQRVTGQIGNVTFTDAPISQLARFLSKQVELGGRSVIDQTGLTDKYDFALQWTPEALTPVPGQMPATDSSAPSIFTALDEQLGLKLESRKEPMEILVIDHIEHPSEN